MGLEQTEYQVLARKYRPKTLSELIGQDVLVRTLTHAIEQQRLPHAFILTGIRGVGKTSTARIIAKCLNYRGADGLQEMTPFPKDDCSQCKAIEESRHPDVLEMDAASRTGVGDIREIIESVNYAPTMARYKVYIIDEVHMLSKSAFNALLKTLEEPPPHCKFIFATTEIRKIPVTILSRCMRFDLPRVEADVLTKHFMSIAEKEKVQVDEQAARMVAYAAEGSVRDGLSILDQAIGLAGGAEVTASLVSKMLGQGDRTKLYELMQVLLEGKVVESVSQLQTLYRAGAEPTQILHDLLELTHIFTSLRIGSNDAVASHLPAQEFERASALSAPLGVAFLMRLWQMLLKGIQEVDQAPNALMAAEMVLIRIAYAADMPPPNDLLKKLTEQGSQTSATAQPYSMQPSSQPMATASITSYESLVALCEAKGERFMASYLEGVRVATFDVAGKKFEFTPQPTTPGDLAPKLTRFLLENTNERWLIAVSMDANAPSIKEKREAQNNQQREMALNDSLVKAAMKTFAGAEVISVEEIEHHVDADIQLKRSQG